MAAGDRCSGRSGRADTAVLTEISVWGWNELETVGNEVDPARGPEDASLWQRHTADQAAGGGRGGLARTSKRA